MTDFWKSGERKWCEYCEVFVRFNLVKQHEQTPKHKSRVDRSLSQQRAGRTKEGLAEEQVKRELAKMERLASGAVMNDVAAGRAQAHETTKTFASQPFSRAQSASALPPPQQVRQKMTVEEEVAQLWKEESNNQQDEEEEVNSEEVRRQEEEREREEEEKRIAESKRRDALAQANYDPLNPFGAWVEVEKVVAPVQVKFEESHERKTRKQIKEEENERFEEDVEDDVNQDFKIERMVANSSVYNEAVVKDEEDDIQEEVVFKKKSGKERNARKKIKTDINE